MSNKVINSDNEINHIFDNIKDLVINSRNKIYQTVNTEMLNLYWNIAKAIMEIQQGDERASYGDAVLEKLSQKLTNEFGKGFSKRNLSKPCENILSASFLTSELPSLPLVCPSN